MKNLIEKQPNGANQAFPYSASGGYEFAVDGLTKREYMATKFLASLIVHEHSPVHDGTDYLPTITDLCNDAVRYADRLLEELEKGQERNEIIEGEKLGEMNHLKEPDTEW